MKHMTIQYGTGVVPIPAAALERMDRANVIDIRLLFALCADRRYLEDFDAHKGALAAEFGCAETDIEAALSFWRGAGVLDGGERKPRAAAHPVARPDEDTHKTVKADKQESRVRVVSLRPSDNLPHYTTDELTALLEKRREATALIDECQRALGKIFNTREVNIILGLLDYLGLDSEYVLLLCTYCAKIGKTSLAYVEKTAFGLFEEGIDEAGLLQEKLRRMEAVRDAEGQLRRLFGMGERKLTPNEHKLLSRWIDEWGFDMAMVEKAYQVTVDTIGKASMKYAGGVLQRWYDDGIRTPEQAEENQAAWDKSKKKKDEPSKGSFDTDDFVEAALRRSFDDM